MTTIEELADGQKSQANMLASLAQQLQQMQNAHEQQALYARLSPSTPARFGSYPTGAAIAQAGTTDPGTTSVIADGSVTAGSIAPGAITTPGFASTIRPITLVTALPSLPDALYPVGSFVYKTTDSPARLYKNVADVWVAAIGPNDIQADSITAGQIAAGAIGATEIAVGSIGGTAFSGPPANLVPDPGWEVGGFWNQTRTTEAPRSGLYNGKVSALVTAFLTSPMFPVEGSHRYKVSGWARGNNTNTSNFNIALYIRWHDTTGTQIGADVLVAGTVAWGQNNSYRNWTAILTAPVGAAKAFAFWRHEGSGAAAAAYYDDMEVYRVDGDVSHAGGNVVIDSTGVTITNGALTFKDAFGSTAMDGNGFGSAWDTFIDNGIYNSLFVAGAAINPLPSGRTVSLPYWTVAKSGSPTVQTVADATWPGGKYVSFAPSALADYVTLKSDLVPVMPGMPVNVRLFGSVDSVGVGTGYGAANVRAYWFDSDGAAISNAVISADTCHAATPGWDLIRMNASGGGLLTSPASARFVQIEVKLYEAGTAHEAATWVKLGGVSLLYGQYAYNVEQLHLDLGGSGTAGGIQMGPTGEIHIYRPASNTVAFDALSQFLAGAQMFYKSGTVSDADFGTTPTNGTLAVDGTNHRIYLREGGAWHYVNRTAGFQIPVDVDGVDERLCPVCGEEMGIGDPVAGMLNGRMSDGALHGLWCHLRCAKGLS